MSAPELGLRAGKWDLEWEGPRRGPGPTSWVPFMGAGTEGRATYHQGANLPPSNALFTSTIYHFL